MTAPQKEKPTANIHLGIKDIYPSLVSKAADIVKDQMAERSTVLVRSDQFKNSVRPALVKIAASARGREFAFDHYSQLGYVPKNIKKIAISQHGALGSLIGNDHDFLSNSDTLSVLQGLEDFFENAAICIHLTIVCQHDYGPIVDSADPYISVVSWADIASRILKAVPSATLTVWALDDPQSLAVPFVVRLLGLDGIDLSPDLQKRIRGLANEQRFGRPVKQMTRHMDDLSQFLDAQYERDLILLQNMPHVTVIGE